MKRKLKPNEYIYRGKVYRSPPRLPNGEYDYAALWIELRQTLPYFTGAGKDDVARSKRRRRTPEEFLSD